jgi:hypothetical protein
MVRRLRLSIFYLLSFIFYYTIFSIYYLLSITYSSISYSFLSLTYSSISYSFLSLTYSSIPNPASSPAGRTPPYGGIARPKGKHSRHKGVFCLPAADSRPESGICFASGICDSQRDENPAGFRPRQGLDENPKGFRPPQGHYTSSQSSSG